MAFHGVGMALPGIATVLGVVARIVNNLIPSRKEALMNELNNLLYDYKQALEKGHDTKAAEILKKIKEIRKKARITDEL